MEVLIMSKRTFNLIVGVSGGVAAIGIAETAAVEICSLFVEKE